MTTGNPRHFYRGIGLALMLAIVVLTWLEPEPGSLHARLRGLAYDTILPKASPRPDPRVVIVDIDEESLAQEGRWPWPRDRIAALVERLREGEPAVIGLDILFPEAGDPAGDAALARQLAAPEVVSAVAFALDSPGAAGPAPSAMAALAPSLGGGHVSLGHITPLHDPDHVIRRVHPEICTERCYFTLAIAMMTNWSGVAPALSDASLGRQLCVGSFCQRLNPDGSLSIPFHYPGRFARLPAADVLAGNIPTDRLQGSMVLVGTSAVGLGDLVATPLAANTPGVELHALLLAALMDNFHWAELPHGDALTTLGLMLLLLATLAWPAITTPVKMAGTLLAITLAGLPLVAPIFGYWLNPLPVWSAGLAVGLLWGGWELYLVLSQRRRIYRSFAAYVPPVVLRNLVKQGLGPDQLDAQRADVTVFFADIQGFTALSERLEPEQLVEITSHLFSEITEEVHRHRGTLDKFMGDAVMAFWGAPLPLYNHPQLALDCALAVDRRLRAMGPWLASRGYPEIRMTMGLESGTVTVGNLGSRQRRAYTIMGKTVNLAAHLQQQCKAVGLGILCGPELCARLPPERVQRLEPTEIRGIEGPQVIGFPAGLKPLTSSAAP